MRTLTTLFACLLSSSIFAQWSPVELPPTYGNIYNPIIGLDGSMWLNTNYLLNPEEIVPSEFMHTEDLGATFQTGILEDDINEFSTFLQPVTAQKAWVIAASNYEAVYWVKKTSDGGLTWQVQADIPSTYPDMIYFFDEQHGAYLGDPDELGLVAMITNDGGETFTRIDPSTMPLIGPNELPLIGFYESYGNMIAIVVYDFVSDEVSFLITQDQGNSWALGQRVHLDNPYKERFAFVDENHGMVARGIAGVDNLNPLYTTDGGMTWQESGPTPGSIGFGLETVPNTNTIFGVFVNQTTNRLFSALTNDLGKTWNTFVDIGDASYYPNDNPLPSSVISSFAVVDNHTVWGKITQDELVLYHSETPIVPNKPDLELQLTADNPGLPLYGHVKYTLTITNRGTAPATDVRVDWLPPYKQDPNGIYPYAFVGAYTDNGYYDSWNGIWTMKTLWPGQSSTTNFHLYVLQDQANVVQTAQVKMCNEQDIDSQPANMVYMPTQDDEAMFNAVPSSGGSALMAYQSDETTDNASFSVFPNPSNGAFTLHYAVRDASPLKICITNALNQKVYEQEVTDSQFGSESLSLDLATGVYMVSFETSPGVVEVQKLVIVR
jgi:photosystem II stability/assembly factor-like uncharacterized protein